MNTLTLTILFILSLIPLGLCVFKIIKKATAQKTMLFVNIGLVLVIGIACMTNIFATPVKASKAPDQVEIQTDTTSNLSTISVGAGLGILAAALVTAISCIGAGIAVAASASAAIGAISENPAVFGKAMIFVALAEGVALYGMLISIQILNLFN